MTLIHVEAELDLPDGIPQEQYKNMVFVTKELQEAQIDKIAELQSTITDQAETIKRYQGLMEHHIVGKCSNCNYMASWPVCTKCGTSYPAQELEVKG